MRRGTTPTNTFEVEVDLTAASEMYITYEQGGCVVIEKTLSDVTITPTSVATTLTQLETLSLRDGVPVDIQIRVKFTNGSAIASNIIKTTVGRILKDGVI